MDTRLLVIEYAIIVDELLSFVICEILNIDINESKSFGNISSSLSFNQKVQLFSDIKTIDKDSKIKFETLLTIRNKFAHVSSIDSFNSFFITNAGKEVFRKFKNWYSIDDKKKSFHSLCFVLLCKDLIFIIEKTYDQHMYNLGYEKGKVDAQKELINNLLTSLKEKKI